MKKPTLLFCLVLLSFLLLPGCRGSGHSEQYELGFEEGFSEGYDEGRNDSYDEIFESGYDVGYEDGYDNGYDDGRSDHNLIDDDDYDGGYDDGYDDGYSDGNADGYYEGAAFTCLFFGDVDRAFQCADNGAAWFAFLDGYDQYISDIYSDDTTRSELFWAFISLTMSGDPTSEEIDLLIDTFGRDLFIRNGISIDP